MIEITLEAFASNGEGVGTKIGPSGDNGARRFTAGVRVDDFDSFEVGHEIRSPLLRIERECELVMEHGYVIRVGLVWLRSVPIGAFSVNLCDLGVSAVKLDMHRRGAENAEETQRISIEGHEFDRRSQCA